MAHEDTGYDFRGAVFLRLASGALTVENFTLECIYSVDPEEGAVNGAHAPINPRQ
jgi:hypothetical protein